jgi:hypothetical protein
MQHISVRDRVYVCVRNLTKNITSNRTKGIKSKHRQDAVVFQGLDHGQGAVGTNIIPCRRAPPVSPDCCGHIGGYNRPSMPIRMIAIIFLFSRRLVHTRSSDVNVRLHASVLAITLAPSTPNSLSVQSNSQNKTAISHPLFGVVPNA